MLTVVRADRKEDSGIYKIRLTCMGGSNEATGRVNVLDVPTKPRNFQTDEASCEVKIISQSLDSSDVLTVRLSASLSLYLDIYLSCVVRSELATVVCLGMLQTMTEARPCSSTSST